MKRPIRLVLVAALTLTGCAEANSRIEVFPNDASITLDGRPVGRGSTVVSLGPELGPPASHRLLLAAPGYHPLELELNAVPDRAMAGARFALLALVSAGALYLAVANSANDFNRPTVLGLGVAGGLGLLASPLALWGSHRFESQYRFRLQHRSPDPAASPDI